MHVLALIVGGWLHIVGDVGLCAAGVVTAYGLNGYVYDEYYTNSRRGSLPRLNFCPSRSDYRSPV